MAVLLLAAAALAASAQDYPTKPIKLIVPFPPSGGTDILARVVAQKLAENNKWTVVVDNRPGAGGNIGVDAVAKSPPDGYTLVMGQTSNLAINPTLYKNLPYDPLKDLAPVALVGQGPVALVVRADSQYKTLGDLIAAAKAKPSSISMASPGNGTVAHLSGVRLMNASGAKFEHIPYKGAGSAIPDILGGNVDFFVSSVPTLQSQVAGGRMRALAVTSLKRSSAAPALPTIAESGYPGFEVTNWNGLLAPAKTPGLIIRKLHLAIVKILALPDTRARLADLGMEAIGNSPEEFAATIKTDIAKWAKLIRDSDIKVE